MQQFINYADKNGLEAAMAFMEGVVTDEPILPVLRNLYVEEGQIAARREQRYLQQMYGKEYDQLRARRKGVVVTRSGKLKAFAFFMDWAKAFTDFFNTTGFLEVRRITETTRKWLRDRANSLLGEDLTLPEIRDILIDEANGINRRRANVIARTETLTVLNNGSNAAAKALPIRMSHTWIATEDNRTRHSHRVIDGQTVPLTAPFSNGGMYPGDPTLPAKERIQCRCVEVHTPVRDREGMLILK